MKKRVSESKIRQKGEEQRKAAEEGRALGFYTKEIAKRVLNPFRKIAQNQQIKDEAL